MDSTAGAHVGPGCPDSGAPELTASSRLDTLRAGLQRLSGGLASLRQQMQETNAPEAPDFNIFHLLGMAYAEVGTHSVMLAELLSPTGRHSQGFLFLRGFLDMCSAKGWLEIATDDLGPAQAWQVHREINTRYGNLDLVLALKGGPLIVIENKIWAGEQDKQVERYADWLEEQPADRYPPEQRLLLYLTPEGSPAKSNGEKPYQCLSYASDILNWLKEAIEQVSAPAVREILRQYMDVIAALGGKGMADSPKEQQVLDLLCTPENMITTLEVVTRAGAIGRHYRNLFWSQVKSTIDKKLSQDGLDKLGWQTIKEDYKLELFCGDFHAKGIFFRASQPNELPTSFVEYGVSAEGADDELRATPLYKAFMGKLDRIGLRRYLGDKVRWQYISCFLTGKNDISCLVDGDRLQGMVADEFWDFFLENREAVEEINHLIV